MFQKKNNFRLLLILVGLSFLLGFFLVLNQNEQNLEEPINSDVETDKSKEEELKSKIGQMFIVGFRGTEVEENSAIVKAIKELNLGGVILFDYDAPSKGEIERNITSLEQTKRLITDLKEINSSLIVAVDAEGGYVNRLKEKYGFEKIPSAEEMGKGTATETYSYGSLLGQELKELGFNMNFAPVVDVNLNPDNPVIGKLERSFSSQAEEVTVHAFNFIQGLEENGIIPVIKHFPGHGSSESDSHLGMVDITETYSQEKELLPYQNLLSVDYSGAIMTAHVINKNIDPDYPATLSSLFLRDILREQLGFKGVIISDDMQMEAIGENYGGFSEAVVKAMEAGCDWLIISNNGTYYNENSYSLAIEAVFEAVQEGRISESRLDESLTRINNLKENYGI